MFSTKQVTKVTGVKTERLRTWIVNNWVGPSIQVASGQGTRNIWDITDLYDVMMFRRIIESGLSRAAANDFISQGLFTGAVDPDQVRFVLYAREKGQTVGTVIYKNDTHTLDKIFSDLEINPDNAFLLNFENVKKEVDETVKRLFGKNIERWQRFLDRRHQELHPDDPAPGTRFDKD